MQCPKCGFNQKDHQLECAKCGLVFRKYQRAAETSAPKDIDEQEPDPQGALPFLQELLLGVPPETSRLSFYGFHDWEYILTETGLLPYDQTLAHLSYDLGIFFMFLAVTWGGYLLFKQYQNLS